MIEFKLNGKLVRFEGNPLTRLIDVIREDLDLTGTKEGCGEGECGACSVLRNGKLVTSCIIPVGAVAGDEIITIEVHNRCVCRRRGRAVRFLHSRHGHGCPGSAACQQ